MCNDNLRTISCCRTLSCCPKIYLIIFVFESALFALFTAMRLHETLSSPKNVDQLFFKASPIATTTIRESLTTIVTQTTLYSATAAFSRMFILQLSEVFLAEIGLLFLYISVFDAVYIRYIAFYYHNLLVS